MLSLRVMAFLWPFLKEMLLGGKGFVEALSAKKRRLMVIGLIFFSIFLNFFTIPRLLRISADYVEMKKKYENIEKTAKPVTKPTPRVKEITKPIEKIPASTTPPIDPSPGTTSPPKHRNKNRTQAVKETFDRIRDIEEKEKNSIPRS